MIERRVRNVAWLVAGCFFMEMLDATIVVTSIPQISSSLHTAPDSAGLIVTSYLVTLAVLIPLSAWLTRRFGYRRVFLSAIVIFTLASLGCAASQTLAELVAMRVVQGIGGAMMVPVGRLIVFDGSDRSQLMRLMSYIVWPGLIAPVIAPLAGGVITTYASWQWLFLINVPLGAIAFVAGWRLVHGAPAGAPPRLDRLGVVLTCTGLGGLTYTAHLASAQEPDLAAVAALGIASVVLIAAAAVHLLRADAPLVDLRTLRIHTLRVGTAAASLYFMVISAIPFLLPLLFQTVFGWSAIKSGSLVLFIFVGNVAIKPATTVIYRRGGFRRTLIAASITLAATAIVCATFSDGTPLIVIAVVAVISGAARSVGLTGLSTLSLSDVPTAELPSANALYATAQQLFSALGVAAASVFLRLGPLLVGHDGQSAVYAVAFIAVGVLALLATMIVLRLRSAAGEGLAASRRRSGSAPSRSSSRP